MAWPNGQARVVALTIPAAQFVGPLSSFPVLIDTAALTDSGDIDTEILDADTSGSTECQSDGGDIRFAANSDGTGALDYEIVTFTKNSTPASASVEIWVKVDLAENAGAGTTIYMAWDTAGTTSDGSNAANVWSDYQYVGHMQTDGTDATGNATPTTTGTPSDETGAFGGGAQGFATDSSYFSLSCGTYVTTVTMQAWAYATDALASDRAPRAVCLGDVSATNQQLNLGGNLDSSVPKTTFQLFNGTNYETVTAGTTIAQNTWYMLHGVQAASDDREQYTDGALDGSNTSSATLSGVDQIRVGVSADSTPFGDPVHVDEVRVRYDALSSDWISAEYNNQSAPASFITTGTPTDVSGGGGSTIPIFHHHYSTMRAA